MKILFIGQYNEGSTTRMRGEYLQKILQPEKFVVANIDVPIAQTTKIFRSVGWRFYKGPLIKNINGYIHNLIKGTGDFDLVWVDKGVFIEPELITLLNKQSNIVVHYTPDTAFTYNRSQLFYASLPFYNYCITTKSFELDDYKKAGTGNIIYCTQGYDERVHKSYHSFEQKEGVCFIGLNEPEREEIIFSLLDSNIPVKLAGANWERFVKKQSKKSNLSWHGNGLFGIEYAKFISGSLLGLGLLSKKFPELHTTRTFEIPACGTALITERNDETAHFYTNDEVVFFDDKNELPEKINGILKDKDKLHKLSNNGYNAVKDNDYDYRAILSRVLKEMRMIN